MVRRLVTASMLGLLAMLVFAMPALAGRTWCSRDPIVALNDANVQVWVSVPEEYEYLVSGPIVMDFKTPTTVDRELIFTDEGFNGHGEVVSFSDHPSRKVAKDGSFTVRITAKVPIDRALARKNITANRIPLRIEVIEDGVSRTVAGMNTGATIEVRVQPAS